MRKESLLITSLAVIPLLAMTCNREPIPDLPMEEIITSYRNMEITSFSYGALPADGGKAMPTVTYKYQKITENAKGQKLKEETLTDGASFSFYSDSDAITIDKTTGEISVPINETIKDISFTVYVTVYLEALKQPSNTPYKLIETTKGIDVIQTANEECLLSSETIRLPLLLGPHECVHPTQRIQEEGVAREISYTSFNTDGRYSAEDRYEHPNIVSGSNYVGEPECISVMGTKIMVSGGQIARIDKYRSGKIDTIILINPVFETKTTYRLLGQDYCYTSGIDSPEDHLNPPSADYSGNIWTINQVGVGAKTILFESKGNISTYCDVNHTLSATIDGDALTLSLRQHENDFLGETTDKYVDVHFLRIGVQRDYYNWPDIEDYPPGSKPKWPLAYDVYTMYDWSLPTIEGQYYYDDYHRTYLDTWCWADVKVSPQDTKDLHPDSNRTIGFMTYSESVYNLPQRRYLTGELSPIRYGFSDFRFNVKEVTVTATAEVPLQNGMSKTYKHTYSWSSECRTMGNYYAVVLPVIEEASDDFYWTLKFDYTFFRPGYEDTFCGYTQEELKDNSNFYDYAWPNFEYRAYDRKSLISDWEDDVKLSGFLNPSYDSHGNEAYLPDFIDGIPRKSSGNN